MKSGFFMPDFPAEMDDTVISGREIPPGKMKGSTGIT
jgi:hypothetical protein